VCGYFGPFSTQSGIFLAPDFENLEPFCKGLKFIQKKAKQSLTEAYEMRISPLHRRGPCGRRRRNIKSAAASGSVGFLSTEFKFG